jgi:hypothetical protein
MHVQSELCFFVRFKSDPEKFEIPIFSFIGVYFLSIHSRHSKSTENSLLYTHISLCKVLKVFFNFWMRKYENFGEKTRQLWTTISFEDMRFKKKEKVI